MLEDPKMPFPSAQAALDRLIAGNARFVRNLSDEGLTSPVKRLALVVEQNPFAIILGCSDSRVPAELVFDQGLGDLFVIRVAGNIVAPSQIGSIELALDRFGTSLVMVLGHSNCGMVDAALAAIERNVPSSNSRNVLSIVDRIRSAIEPVVQTFAGQPRSEIWAKSVTANVGASVDQLRHGSELIERFVAEGRLAIVGAEYELTTGKVRLLTPGS